MRDINAYHREFLRKLIHLISAVLGIGVLTLDRTIVLPVFIALGILLPAMDLLRFRVRFFDSIFKALFGYVARPYEMKGLTGASYVFISAAVCVLLFDRVAAGTGLLFMSVGDAFAAIVGEKYGKTRIRGKSLEGTLSFISVCFVVVLLVPGLSLITGLTAAVIAAVIELIPFESLDDNLMIPIVSALIIQILGG
ncbi:MAG: hypothetical protein GXO91_07530 [FCB group bacterium]|nr:hypothetical protein [FCB group bacterium]